MDDTIGCSNSLSSVKGCFRIELSLFVHAFKLLSLLPERRKENSYNYKFAASPQYVVWFWTEIAKNKLT